MKFIPHTPADEAAMLKAIGVERVEDLFADIPAELRFPTLDLPDGLSQLDLERRLGEMAGANLDVTGLTSFLGAGAYRHYSPPVVDALIQRGEFLTAYTPYQPEISQGTLTAVFEFQSMIAALAGLDVANASLYDGASALAEAALMAARATRRDGVVVAASVNPSFRDVTRTYVQGLSMPVTDIPWGPDGRIDIDAARQAVGPDTACLAVGYPNFFGVVEDLAALAEIAHAAGALLIAVVNPTALGLLEAPGRLGADIVVGEGQPLGLPLMFGGPYLGLMATTTQYVRSMPGRVVGEAQDIEGRRAYVMTLRAREQDIRREKATSNICTNQNLVALAATIYMAALGDTGFREVAEQCYHKAHFAHDLLASIPGVEPAFAGPYFHEFALRLPWPVADLNDELLAEGILGPYDLGRAYDDLAGIGLFCVTEVVTRGEIGRLAEVMSHMAAQS